MKPVRRSFGLVVKRGIDIAGSFEVLLRFSPLAQMVSGAIRLCSARDRVLCLRTLVVMNGRAFAGYEFRIMVPNADELKKELLARNETTGPVRIIKHGLRITPLGRWLSPSRRIASLLECRERGYGPSGPAPTAGERGLAVLLRLDEVQALDPNITHGAQHYTGGRSYNRNSHVEG
jgi:hypothetical protein